MLGKRMIVGCVALLFVLTALSATGNVSAKMLPQSNAASASWFMGAQPSLSYNCPVSCASSSSMDLTQVQMVATESGFNTCGSSPNGPVLTVGGLWTDSSHNQHIVFYQIAMNNVDCGVQLTVQIIEYPSNTALVNNLYVADGLYQGDQYTFTIKVQSGGACNSGLSGIHVLFFLGSTCLEADSYSDYSYFVNFFNPSIGIETTDTSTTGLGVKASMNYCQGQSGGTGGTCYNSVAMYAYEDSELESNLPACATNYNAQHGSNACDGWDSSGQCTVSSQYDYTGSFWQRGQTTVYALGTGAAPPSYIGFTGYQYGNHKAGSPGTIFIGGDSYLKGLGFTQDGGSYPYMNTGGSASGDAFWTDSNNYVQMCQGSSGTNEPTQLA